MAGIAEKKGNKDLARTFWNTYHCVEKIYTANGRLFGKYCGNRCCTVCLGIRKAEMIRKYLPELNKWSDVHFITLTAKSVPASRLHAFIENLLYGFNKIIAKYKKRAQRGKGKKLIGVRLLESNFNPQKKTYNPHLHILVPDRETADILIREWLSTPIRKKLIDIRAQDIRRVSDNEKVLIEVIKYGSKIFTDPDMKKTKKGERKHMIYARALYNIVEAMQGIRLFERFGFNLPKENRPIKQATLLNDFNEYLYNSSRIDWIDTNSNQSLSNYVPTLELEYLLKKFIDSEIS